MSDLRTQCRRCGGTLSEQGWCQICGTEQLEITDNIAIGDDPRFESGSQAATKQPPAGAQLFNKSTNERYPLSQSVSKIGRDQSNSIALPKDSYVSRHHAWVLFIKGSYWVEDLGSTNGTLLNGELLTERKQIFPGDCLKMGRTELIFELS